MNHELFLFILFLLGFVLLVYTIIILVKRKEYENKRIFSGYNVLIFGIIFLALSTFLKTIKFGFLSFRPDLIHDIVIYLDIVTQIFLLPLFAVSFFAIMPLL